MSSKIIEIDKQITVRDLAKKLDVPVISLITQLMKSGVMATVNESIDFDTAQIVVGELDEEIELKAAEKTKTQKVKRKPSDKAVTRPPVVAVMGHVDHGKTSLLDAIRGADQAEHEAGGITQHISSYQITFNDQKITMLDTPGHEAFAALREHGAKLTDVAIIVIAADDGIKPQTEEALRFAQQAGVKLIIAINKSDKAGANPNLVKQQLSDKKLLVEEWGGDTIAVEVSAKTGEGIDKLLEMVLLVAEVEELKADERGLAEGLIIEAHMEKGRGSVATALVEHGRLDKGEFMVAGGAYAKIRTLQDTNGQDILHAGPSTPVIVTGFKKLPHFGDMFRVVRNEKQARKLAEEFAQNQSESGSNAGMTGSDLIAKIDKTNLQSQLNVILKADVQGSLTSLVDSLDSLERDEVQAKVVGSGIGDISENDISLASTSEAIIYGFNVGVPVNVKQTAVRDGVDIRMYKVIYELLDDITAELTKRLTPDIVESDVGRLLIKGVFRTTKTEVICGGEVSKGKITPGLIAKIYRGDELLAEAEVVSVKKEQAEVKEVKAGEMCGVQLKTDGKLMVQEGDKLELISRETVQRKL